jgi:hypothetical protein
MQENSFERDEELGDDCAILKKFKPLSKYGLHNFRIRDSRNLVH